MKKGSRGLDRRRVAVLPFSNMSPDPNDEYFADGITEELIATISKIREVSVVSRTSMMQYRKNPKSIRDVAEELQAGTILEGSVGKAGNKVRVTVQLVDAAQDKHEWAESYDRGPEDIFAIQSDISHNVAEVLKVRLLANEKQRLATVPTRNIEAYMLFLKARSLVNQRTLDGFYRAIGCFEEAVKHDPGYAAAYAGLSGCYGLLEGWSLMRPQVAWPKALEYAAKALELDDTLAEAHTSMAPCLAHMKRDWKGSEREYRHALELNPSYANAHYWYAYELLTAERRWDEAIREMGEAGKLDPFSLIIAANTGRVLLWAGRREDAIRQLQRVLKVNPEYWFARAELGTALVSTSSIEEGTAEIEKALGRSHDNVWVRAALAYACMAADRKDDVEVVVQQLRRVASETYVPGTVIAAVYAVLGEKNPAFEWLERAVEDHSSTLTLLSMPLFDSLRADPRYKKLRERIGLS